MITHTAKEPQVCRRISGETKSVDSDPINRSGTVAYKCQTCNTGFTRKDSLVRHLNLYLGKDRSAVGCNMSTNDTKIQKGGTVQVKAEDGQVEADCLSEHAEETDSQVAIMCADENSEFVQNDDKLRHVTLYLVKDRSIVREPGFKDIPEERKQTAKKGNIEDGQTTENHSTQYFEQTGDQGISLSINEIKSNLQNEASTCAMNFSVAPMLLHDANQDPVYLSEGNA